MQPGNKMNKNHELNRYETKFAMIIHNPIASVATTIAINKNIIRLIILNTPY